MVKLPRIEHFLCCISLRTGILSMAYIGVASDVMSLLAILVLMNTTDDTHEEDLDQDNVLLRALGEKFFAHEIYTIIVNLGLMTLLILGVIKKRPGFFLPWIAVAGFGIILYTILLVALPFLLALFLPDMPVLCTAIFGGCLLIYLFCGHFFLVVHSYYRQLKAEIQLKVVQNEMMAQNEMQERLDHPPSYADVVDEKVPV